MPDEPTPAARRRRSFGPVVVLGLLGAGIVAWAGTKPWAEVDGASGHTGSAFVTGVPGSPGAATTGEVPLALALALVVLACWGVLLATRGRVRRGVAVLAAAGAAGLVATVAVNAVTLRDRVVEQVSEQTLVPASDLTASTTTWLWVAAVGSLVALVPAVLAVAWCPAWPEMGSRYDAPVGAAADGTTAGGPAGGPAGDVPPTEQSNLDLWKQLDEGRDPTA